ncbi:class I SAM-dependent methyltransferase [Pseudonocardiaceae bacterium YIM PH 21723]|nr:class I SAM-dependent methyltransferase [Pseudonocardiaceae bacterium YIM PH 21723]
MPEATFEFIAKLYRRYADELAAARSRQQAFLAANPQVKAQLDDIEAEITYLLLREHEPRVVVEIGTFHGWSTTWILQALADNGRGELRSFDIVDHAVHNVPAELAGDRWTFHQGDVRQRTDAIPADTDYLFIDAAHSMRFANWYIDNLFPRVRSGIPVSVHDVFHGRWAKPFTEGPVILRWLSGKQVPYFTASAARARTDYRRLMALKQELGLADPVRTSTHNPMIFFTLP